MKKVFKYELQIEDYQTLQLPLDTEILAVKAMYGRIFMWCLVDPNCKKKSNVKFHLVGTGTPIDDEEAKLSDYVGTVFLTPLVFHIFVIREVISIPVRVPEIKSKN